MYRASMGDFEYESLRHGDTPWLTKAFWGVFVFFSLIVLMNMLVSHNLCSCALTVWFQIAMMAETYDSLRAEAKTRWRLLHAGAVLGSERSILRYLVQGYHSMRKGKKISLDQIRPVHHIEADYVNSDGEPIKDEQGDPIKTWEMHVEKRLEDDSDPDQDQVLKRHNDALHVLLDSFEELGLSSAANPDKLQASFSRLREKHLGRSL